MKRIATLTCLDAGGSVCTGAGCLGALATRKGSFAAYAGEEVIPVAFFQCSGCGKGTDDAGLREKLDRIRNLRPDAVHVGVCTRKQDGSRCPTIRSIMDELEADGIPCIDGTHG